MINVNYYAKNYIKALAGNDMINNYHAKKIVKKLQKQCFGEGGFQREEAALQ